MFKDELRVRISQNINDNPDSTISASKEAEDDKVHIFHSVKAVFEAKSSTSPGTVELEEMTSFLPVPPRYLVGVGPSKQVGFRVLIDKKNRS